MQKANFINESLTNYKAIAEVVEEKWIRHDHTEEDKQEIQANLSKHLLDMMDLQDELKAVQEQFKPKIDQEKKAVAYNRSKLKRGYEEEKVECYGIANHTTGMMEFFTADGKMVDSRRLHPSERQLSIHSNL